MKVQELTTKLPYWDDLICGRDTVLPKPPVLEQLTFRRYVNKGYVSLHTKKAKRLEVKILQGSVGVPLQKGGPKVSALLNRWGSS